MSQRFSSKQFGVKQQVSEIIIPVIPAPTKNIPNKKSNKVGKKILWFISPSNHLNPYKLNRLKSKTLIKCKNILSLMKEVVRKEIVKDLIQAQEILNKKDSSISLQLKELSDHAIEDVALQKDLDLISVTVLIYSLGKVIQRMPPEEIKDLSVEIGFAIKFLKENSYSRYNKAVKSMFNIIRKSDAKVKLHLQDVMQAAKIKKGAILLGKGLSIGQAAGLMGLSNWDLQSYAGKTTMLEFGKETVKEGHRLNLAISLFGAG